MAFETIQILRTHPEHYELLSERYLDRAETNLLRGEYDLALRDFDTASRIADGYVEEEFNRALLFRACFGKVILYGAQDMMDQFYESLDLLNHLLASCTCCFQENNSIRLVSTTNGNQPIYGPDRISVQECIEFAEGTVEKCRYLIQCVPKRETRVILNILIDGLNKQAIACCKAGGIWKACLQPLVNKWYLWNQKWKLFSIPPDPTWD